MTYNWSSVTGQLPFTESIERGSGFCVDSAQQNFYFYSAVYEDIYVWDLTAAAPTSIGFLSWFDANYSRPNFNNGWILAGIAWFGGALIIAFNAFNSGLGDDSAHIARFNPSVPSFAAVADLESDFGITAPFPNTQQQNGWQRVAADNNYVIVAAGQLPTSNYRLVYSLNGISWNVETSVGVRPSVSNLGFNTGQRRSILIHSVETAAQRVREPAWPALANYPVGSVGAMIGYGHGFTFFSPPATPGQMLKSDNFGNTLTTADGPTFQTLETATGGSCIVDANAEHLACVVKGQDQIYRFNDITNLWESDSLVGRPTYMLFAAGGNLYAVSFELAAIEFHSSPLGLDCGGQLYYGSNLGLAKVADSPVCLETPDGLDIQFDGDRLFLASYLSGLPDAEMVLYADPPYTEVIDMTDNHQTDRPIKAINVINSGFTT